MIRHLVIIVLAVQGIGLLGLAASRSVVDFAAGIGPSFDLPQVALGGAHLVAVAGYLRRRRWGPRLAAALATLVLLFMSMTIWLTSAMGGSVGSAPSVVLLGLIMAAYATVLAGSLRESRSP